MDKRQYYANKINEIIKQAKQDGIRITAYTAGTGDNKDIGVIICNETFIHNDANDDEYYIDNDPYNMIAISLIR